MFYKQGTANRSSQDTTPNTWVLKSTLLMHSREEHNENVHKQQEVHSFISSQHALARSAEPQDSQPSEEICQQKMICLLQQHHCNPKASLHNVPLWATCNIISEADMCNTEYYNKSSAKCHTSRGSRCSRHCQGRQKNIASQAAHIQESKNDTMQARSSMIKLLGSLAMH